MILVNFHRFKTPYGYINSITHNQKLIVLSLPGETVTASKNLAKQIITDSKFEAADNLCLQTEKQLLAYFDGKLTSFDLPLHLTGTQFQKQILNIVAKIPYGCTLTYGQVAQKTGRPKTARAVGTTMARNPLPLIISCHRVLAVNGYGGYAGGLELKLKLLKLERAIT